MNPVRENRAESTWRDHARRYGVRIAPWPLVEILELLDRVVIRAEGWGPSDPRRGQYREIEMRPGLLSRQSRRREQRPPDPIGQRHRQRSRTDRSAPTYRRAVARGEDLGLLLVRRRPGRPSLIAPSWWRHSEDGPGEGLADRVWGDLAARMVSDQCAGNERVMSGYPVRSQAGPIPPGEKALPSVAPAHFGGTVDRVTSDRNYSDGDSGSAATPDRSQESERGLRKLLRKPLPIEDPDLRRRAEEILVRTAGEPDWHQGTSNLEGVIRGMIRDGAPEDDLVDALSETFDRWLAGEIGHPKQYFRDVISRRWGLETSKEILAREDRRRRCARNRVAPRGGEPRSIGEILAPKLAPKAAPDLNPEQRKLLTAAALLADPTRRPDRWEELLPAHGAGDPDLIRELVKRWIEEDRQRPPAQTQSETHEELCAIG